MTCHAYTVTHVATGRMYVGITSKTVARRWKQHLDGAKLEKPRQLLHKAIAKYGAAAFVVEETACATSIEDILAVEQMLIEQLGAYVECGGFNLTRGGDGLFGYRFSDEQRRRLSAAQLGRTNSPETRAKLRAANTGNAPTIGMTGRRHKPETIAAMREKALGRKHSAETIAKYIATRTGRTQSIEHKAAIAAGRLRAKAAREALRLTAD